MLETNFNIVLIEPEIPQNTGNIGRLTLATNCHLHLVKPFGFKLDSSRVKRAGLDYWQHVPYTIYENTEDFLAQHGDKNLVFLSSHGSKTHYEIQYEKNMFLVFGKESVGLPKELIYKNVAKTFRIPIYGEAVRSLNIGNAVGIVVYEGIKSIGFAN